MPKIRGTCTYHGCPRPHFARGYCSRHYDNWRKRGDPAYIRPGYGLAPAERLALKVDCTTDPDGCWPWTGETTDDGYGRMQVGKDKELTHRLTWMLAYGPIPDNIKVCHHCDNPPCCRLDHLFLGTHGDNMADMVAKGRQAVRVLLEVCKRGHPYDEANTYRHGGHRYCRKCRQAVNEHWRRRRSGLAE